MILHGKAAIVAVEAAEKRILSRGEKRVVMLEGYATEPYIDTKGIRTTGVGQTGQWLTRTFKDSYKYHVERLRRTVPDLDNLPEFLQTELVQAEYRGDIGQSPKAMRYLREGKFDSAAYEFIHNAEYKNPATPSQIKKRMDAVHHALLLTGLIA